MSPKGEAHGSGMAPTNEREHDLRMSFHDALAALSVDKVALSGPAYENQSALDYVRDYMRLKLKRLRVAIEEEKKDE